MLNKLLPVIFIACSTLIVACGSGVQKTAATSESETFHPHPPPPPEMVPPHMAIIVGTILAVDSTFDKHAAPSDDNPYPSRVILRIDSVTMYGHGSDSPVAVGDKLPVVFIAAPAPPELPNDRQFHPPPPRIVPLVMPLPGMVVHGMIERTTWGREKELAFVMHGYEFLH